MGNWNFLQCPDPRCGLVWLDPMPLGLQAMPSVDGVSVSRTESGSDGDSRRRRTRVAVREGYLALAYRCRPDHMRAAYRLFGLVMYLRPLRRAELDATVMHLRVVSGGRLLDIGSGLGDRLQALVDAGWRAEGLDVDPAAVAAARDRGLRVHLGALEAQSFPASSFDAVTMSHSIEHVPDPAAILAEIYRILTPGGRVAILTPNARSLGHRWFRSDWLALDPPRHLHIFTRAALGRLVARAGFRRVRMSTSARDAHLILWASRSIRHTGGAALDRLPPTAVRRYAYAARWLEWAAQHVGLQVAEELVVVAEKPATA